MVGASEGIFARDDCRFDANLAQRILYQSVEVCRDDDAHGSVRDQRSYRTVRLRRTPGFISLLRFNVAMQDGAALAWCSRQRVEDRRIVWLLIILGFEPSLPVRLIYRALERPKLSYQVQRDLPACRNTCGSRDAKQQGSDSRAMMKRESKGIERFEVEHWSDPIRRAAQAKLVPAVRRRPAQGRL